MIASLRRWLNSGAVVTWISPVTAITRMPSRLRSSASSNCGESKDTGAVFPIGVDDTLSTRPVRSLAPDQRMCMPEIARAITICWISAVPSKMS